MVIVDSLQRAIFLPNHRLTFDQVQVISDFDEFDEFSKSILSICNKWLRQDQEFSLKTSGSTGNPKTVYFTRKQLQTSAQQTIQALDLKTGTSALTCLNCNFVAGIMMLIRGLEGRFVNYIIPPCGTPLKDLSDAFDFVAMVPMQIRNSIDQHLEQLNECKNVIVGGAPISKDLEASIRSNCTQEVYQTFGMTETLSHFALKNVTQNEIYYTTLTDVEIKTEEGRLCVKTPITKDWITTNDICEIKNEKQFRWLGRADWVINTGGVKVIVEELENHIAKFHIERNQQINFFIAKEYDDQLGEVPILLFEKRFAITPIHDYMTDLKKHLPKYWCPKRVFAVSEFKYTESHKLDRITTLELEKLLLFPI